MCTNGCCKNNPCLNRGTCTDICQPTSVRYNCSCPVPFVGKHCEIQQKRSCQDYKAAGSTASGLYTVDDDNNQTFQVFCDFDSEPGFAWNLIESFSLSNKDRFQVFTFSSIFYKYLEHERRTKAHHQFYFLYRRTSCFTMTTKPSAVMPQIGRLTSSNDPTSFGSEITRLTGELLADTTQMAPYTQIT